MKKRAALQKKTKKKSHGGKIIFIILSVLLLTVAISSANSQNTNSPAVLAAATTNNGFFGNFFSRFFSFFTTSQSTTSSPSLTVVDSHALPLGDGKVATSPQVGYVYSCQTTFTGGGAQHAGNWISGNTWDPSKKIAVEGNVSWPNAAFSATVNGSNLVISGNGLPVGETTGVFPIQSSDPAYQYDRNPNSIKSYTVSYNLPANPQIAANPTCVGMGVIGYALDGVAIYNALDADGRDAVAHEVQDSCSGHPQEAGQYHYHGPSPCMPNYSKSDTVVGYALDGFPITSMYKADGTTYTDADLDSCHGATSAITFPDGSIQDTYHYVLTQEYPYTLGCFKGTPVAVQRIGGNQVQRGMMQNGSTNATNTTMPMGGRAGGPPQAALDVCSGQLSGASCTFAGQNGTTLTGTCQQLPRQSTVACVPTGR